MKGSIDPGKAAGSWYLRFDMGIGPDGKRQQKRVRIKGTKKEAERRLREMLVELERGVYVEPTKLT